MDTRIRVIGIVSSIFILVLRLPLAWVNISVALDLTRDAKRPLYILTGIHMLPAVPCTIVSVYLVKSPREEILLLHFLTLALLISSELVRQLIPVVERSFINEIGDLGGNLPTIIILPSSSTVVHISLSLLTDPRCVHGHLHCTTYRRLLYLIHQYHYPSTMRLLPKYIFTGLGLLWVHGNLLHMAKQRTICRGIETGTHTGEISTEMGASHIHRGTSGGLCCNIRMRGSQEHALLHSICSNGEYCMLLCYEATNINCKLLCLLHLRGPQIMASRRIIWGFLLRWQKLG
jgi:hypothetical protein